MRVFRSGTISPMVAALILVADFRILPGTKSESGRFAVAWRVPGADLSTISDNGQTLPTGLDVEKAENWLVFDGKPTFQLRGLSFFPHENYGAMFVTYNTAETLIAAVHGGKWEPRAFAIMDTRNGHQVDGLAAVRRDSKAWLMVHDRKTFRPVASQVAFDISEVSFTSNDLLVGVVTQIPKNDNYEGKIRLRYHVKRSAEGVQLKFARGNFVKP